MNIEKAAIICHAANKAYCKSIGDNSQTDWEETPNNIKQSVIDGVKKIIKGEVNSPKESHESWLEFKIKEGGWRYGPVKDIEKKIHPCFVAYELLPEQQKIKDEIFFSICTTLKPFINLEGESD